MPHTESPALHGKKSPGKILEYFYGKMDKKSFSVKIRISRTEERCSCSSLSFSPRLSPKFFPHFSGMPDRYEGIFIDMVTSRGRRRRTLAVTWGSGVRKMCFGWEVNASWIGTIVWEFCLTGYEDAFVEEFWSQGLSVGLLQWGCFESLEKMDLCRELNFKYFKIEIKY